MDAYLYKAALLCEDCAIAIKDTIECPGNPEDECTYDSGDYPKGPFADGGEESDHPCHCDHCGTFLENPLTLDGYDYVREALLEHAENGRGAVDVLETWRDFYDMDDGLEEFTDSYIECALWSSTDESDESGGQPMDSNYGPENIEPDTLARIEKDCARFFYANWQDFEGADWQSCEQAGHDFWLTRNGHGAGFWDGDWPEPAATHLTEASKVFGECNLMLSDSGQIYIS